MFAAFVVAAAFACVRGWGLCAGTQWHACASDGAFVIAASVHCCTGSAFAWLQASVMDVGKCD